MVPHPRGDSRSTAKQPHLEVITLGEDCFLKTAPIVFMITTDGYTVFCSLRNLQTLPGEENTHRKYSFW